ncbi:hypothetical protein TraAM80_02943 [Trypanosoma rangeli]|uniref:Uncharacterized protein n=1 Tax=Trypanosoma rangeli TaxID=5698 RepID=A0A3R7NUQ3_TRYRA|nr:uncharacterized protein TraAM80_02943 [Trypanosoma rangeli]RNF08011.1 hypothetical protein TraAM80_02943 [Trypanosoma rangeli]|eukprot:RNF08011.1 hypothetical protein TraAM80_02943 [Trypanosoma rangeli]
MRVGFLCYWRCVLSTVVLAGGSDLHQPSLVWVAQMTGALVTSFAGKMPRQTRIRLGAFSGMVDAALSLFGASVLQARTSSTFPPCWWGSYPRQWFPQGRRCCVVTPSKPAGGTLRITLSG